MRVRAVKSWKNYQAGKEHPVELDLGDALEYIFGMEDGHMTASMDCNIGDRTYTKEFELYAEDVRDLNEAQVESLLNNQMVLAYGAK